MHVALVTSGRHLLLVVALLALTCHVACTDNAETEIKNAILNGYSRTSRPFTTNLRSPVVTSLTMLLRSFQIDEFQMTATVNAWAVMMWRDSRLTWQPSDHGNTYVVSMSSAEIWLPDIILMNGVSHLDPIYMHVPVYVSNGGTVMWVTPATFRVRCQKELSSWPYDQQNCTAIFSSWTMAKDMHEVEPTSQDGRLVMTEDMVKTDSHWQMVSADGFLVNATYKCCPGTVWHELHIELHVARVSMLFALSFILPCVALAVHILAAFWIPPDSSAKIKVVTIHSVALVFFLFNLFWWMPPVGGKTVPKVVSFVSGSLAMSVISALAAVTAGNLVTRADSPPAPLLALFSGVVGTILRLGDLNQQLQSTREPFAEDGVPAQDKEATKTVRRAEWRLVATGLDRCLCLVQLAVFVLLALSCLT